MKPNFKRLPFLAAFLSLLIPSFGARVSEPHTTFYGRVIQRVGDREFLVTEGKLRWTIAIAQPGGKQYEMVTDLRPLGGGQYSYKLQVPHQLLAYDLTVTGKSVPLMAAPAKFRHLDVTINGVPATFVAPAIDGFTADESTRAATYQIDLDVSNLSPDSDGDGIPDWWEDKHGTDKWNPADGPALAAASTADQSEESLTSFARWRAHYFPGDQRDLNLFAADDLDGDQVINLLEYAFGLNPLARDERRTWLPSMSQKDGKVNLEFGARRGVTDLEYVIEISQDLLTWRSSKAEEIKTSVNADDKVFDRVSAQAQGAEEAARSFLRVRVNRKP